MTTYSTFWPADQCQVWPFRECGIPGVARLWTNLEIDVQTGPGVVEAQEVEPLCPSGQPLEDELHGSCLIGRRPKQHVGLSGVLPILREDEKAGPSRYLLHGKQEPGVGRLGGRVEGLGEGRGLRVVRLDSAWAGHRGTNLVEDARLVHCRRCQRARPPLKSCRRAQPASCSSTSSMAPASFKVSGLESSVPSPPTRAIDAAPCLVFVAFTRSWASAGLVVTWKVWAKVGDLGFFGVGPVPAGDRLADLAEHARYAGADDMDADPVVLEVVPSLNSPRRRLDRLAPEPLRFGLIGADTDQLGLRNRPGTGRRTTWSRADRCRILIPRSSREPVRPRA